MPERTGDDGRNVQLGDREGRLSIKPGKVAVYDDEGNIPSSPRRIILAVERYETKAWEYLDADGNVAGKRRGIAGGTENSNR